MRACVCSCTHKSAWDTPVPLVSMDGQGFQNKFPPVSKTIKKYICNTQLWVGKKRERNNTNVKCTAQLSSVQVKINKSA